MFEQDYLMRLLMQFMQAMRRSMEKAEDERDPRAAADMLEAAIGDATELDGATLLSLAPESIATVVQVSGTDPHVCEYVANSLRLEAEYLRQSGNESLAQLREGQACALAQAYGFTLASGNAIEDAREFLETQQSA